MNKKEGSSESRNNRYSRALKEIHNVFFKWNIAKFVYAVIYGIFIFFSLKLIRKCDDYALIGYSVCFGIYFSQKFIDSFNKK